MSLLFIVFGLSGLALCFAFMWGRRIGRLEGLELGAPDDVWVAHKTWLVPVIPSEPAPVIYTIVVSALVVECEHVAVRLRNVTVGKTLGRTMHISGGGAPNFFDDDVRSSSVKSIEIELQYRLGSASGGPVIKDCCALLSRNSETVKPRLTLVRSTE